MTEIDALWEYSDPGASETRFRAALDGAGAAQRLELLTQIARTYSLRRRFDESHATLDEVERGLAEMEPTGADIAKPRVRYLLERGRAFNSSGDRERARGLFMDAWNAGRAAVLEGLAVDAAHMVAITFSGSDEAIRWSERGLELARESSDEKARALVPAMLNNMAWDLHDLGRFDEALPWFEEASAEWSRRGAPKQKRFAKYAVGRCLRSLGRHDEALSIQFALEAEAGSEPDGFVLEEIGENLAAKGQTEAARPYFRRAAEVLSLDPWIAKNEPERLEALRTRSEGTSDFPDP
jgi:tetratricopeptide (TPR) repeat protein